MPPTDKTMRLDDSRDEDPWAGVMPLVVGVLGDFSASPNPPLARREWIEIDAASFDEVLGRVAPQLNLLVDSAEDRGRTQIRVQLNIRCLADFEPARFATQVPMLQALLDRRAAASQVDASAETPAEETGLGLLDQVLDQSERAAGHDPASEQRAMIDDALARQVRSILHDPHFQELERTWRGLRRLIDRAGDCRSVRFRLLSCSQDELFQDFDRATSLEQCKLYRAVCERWVGTDQPFGLLVADYQFENRHRDVELLQALGLVGSIGFCPVVTGAAASVAGLREWTDLFDCRRSLEPAHQPADFVKWRSLREEDDARFVALAAPRFLGRRPYQAANGETFAFDELAGITHDAALSHYCWVNGAVAAAELVIRDFTTRGWHTHCVGTETGGLLDDLPTEHVRRRSDEGVHAFDSSTEAIIGPSRAAELVGLGIMVFSGEENEPSQRVLLRDPTAHKPQAYSRPELTRQAAGVARFSTTLALSRIMLHLLALARRQLPRSSSLDEASKQLTAWLNTYVDPDAESGAPLMEGAVEIKRDPDESEALLVAASLRPHLAQRPLEAAIRVEAPVV